MLQCYNRTAFCVYYEWFHSLVYLYGQKSNDNAEVGQYALFVLFLRFFCVKCARLICRECALKEHDRHPRTVTFALNLSKITNRLVSDQTIDEAAETVRPELVKLISQARCVCITSYHNNCYYNNIFVVFISYYCILFMPLYIEIAVLFINNIAIKTKL